jgi:hypothetical protein
VIARDTGAVHGGETRGRRLPRTTAVGGVGHGRAERESLMPAAKASGRSKHREAVEELREDEYPKSTHASDNQQRSKQRSYRHHPHKPNYTTISEISRAKRTSSTIRLRTDKCQARPTP